MDFRDFYLNLKHEERAEYAKRAATSPNYIQCHLIGKPPRKIPRLSAIKALADATEGACSINEVVGHFMLKVEHDIQAKNSSAPNS